MPGTVLYFAAYRNGSKKAPSNKVYILEFYNDDVYIKANQSKLFPFSCVQSAPLDMVQYVSVWRNW